MPDLYTGPLDAQLGVLVLLCGLVMAALLLPVPADRKRPTPTHDTTRTRRLP